MTTALSPQPLTARVFLFGDGPDTGPAIARLLQQQDVLNSAAGAVGGLARAGRQALGREVGTVVSGLLDVDFGQVAVGAWRKQAALTAAARRTAAAPGSEEIVELAAHKVTSTHHPYLEIAVDGAPVETLRLELTIELLIRALVAVVSHGDLVALEAGQCDATVRLCVEGKEVIARQAQVNLPGACRLGDGISLLPAPTPADTPTAARHPSRPAAHARLHSSLPARHPAPLPAVTLRRTSKTHPAYALIGGWTCARGLSSPQPALAGLPGDSTGTVTRR